MKKPKTWDKVKIKNGKLTGMLTADLLKDVMIQSGRLSFTATGVSVVHIPKSTKRK